MDGWTWQSSYFKSGWQWFFELFFFVLFPFFLTPLMLTIYFIGYTLLVIGSTPFCLQNCINSSWHTFNRVLETFLRDFSPYWHDCITQLLQIYPLRIHDVNLPFHHIPKMLYWIEICDFRGHWRKVNSLSWCIILLEVAIRGWVHCDQKYGPEPEQYLSGLECSKYTVQSKVYIHF